MTINIDPLATFISSNYQLFSGSAVIAGFVYTIRTFRRARKVDELRMLEGIYKDIRVLQRELRDIPQDDTDKIEEWDSSFFNTLEWFSFLVNSNMLKQKKFIDFFRFSIIEWYEKIFLVHAGVSDVDNDKIYPEFKKLYKKMKGRQ
jgi:hypothetical protein